jgi:hypothetical protein
VIEHVAGNQLDVRRCGPPQSGGKVAIDFDRGQVLNPGRETQGQRPGSRTDLEKTIGGSGSDRLDDLFCPCGLEEVLAEPLSYACSIDSPRQNFSSISSISSSLIPK